MLEPSNSRRQRHSTRHTMSGQLTIALEDYLETIFLLQQDRPYARVKDIARERNVKPGSVSPALKRLAAMGLIKYSQREYIQLTESGEAQARRVFAKHQLLTRFFEDVLQVDPEIAEADACAIEHSLSDATMDGLVRFFEFLSICPDAADVIIGRLHTCERLHDGGHDCTACRNRTFLGSGRVPTFPLLELEPGKSARIARVNTKGPVRQRLLDMGMLPQVEVEMVRTTLAGDPIWILCQGSQIALRRKEAAAIMLHRD